MIKYRLSQLLTTSIGLSYRVFATLSNRLCSMYQEEGAILVSGAPRSGTTWLYEILLTLLEYRDVFEPLNPLWSPRWRKICYSRFELCSILGTAFRPYLRIDEEDFKTWKYLDDIFNGKVFTVNAPPTLVTLISKGYSLETRVKDLIKTSKSILGFPLVKVVRGNRLLPWIMRRFKLRAAYMIIRHPCATIASQLRTGTGVPRLSVNELKKMLTYEVLRIEELSKSVEIVKKLEQISTMIEALAAIWALDYYVPLCYQRYGWWHTVVYEKLVLDAKKELKNIFEHIGERIPKEAFIALRRHSRTAWVRKEFVEDPKEVLSKWKKKLLKEDVERVLKVLSWFELNFYGYEIEPNYKVLKSWSCE